MDRRAGVPGLLLLTAGVGSSLVGPVPRTALSVPLGVVLGFGTGLAVALAGSLLGGLAAFALSRTLGRDLLLRLAGPRLVAVEQVLAGRGFGAVLDGRLLPVVPFSVPSHAAGVSAVPTGAYAAATALGLLPSTVLLVGAGAAVPGLAKVAAHAGSRLVLAMVASAAFLVAGTVLPRHRRVGAAQGLGWSGTLVSPAPRARDEWLAAPEDPGRRAPCPRSAGPSAVHLSRPRSHCLTPTPSSDADHPLAAPMVRT